MHAKLCHGGKRERAIDKWPKWPRKSLHDSTWLLLWQYMYRVWATFTAFYSWTQNVWLFMIKYYRIHYSIDIYYYARSPSLSTITFMSYKRRYMAGITFVFELFDVVLIRVDLSRQYMHVRISDGILNSLDWRRFVDTWLKKFSHGPWLMVKVICGNYAMI